MSLQALVVDLFYIVASIVYNVLDLIFIENPLLVRLFGFGAPKQVEGATHADQQGPEVKLGVPHRKFSLIESPKTEEMPRVFMSGRVVDINNKPIENAKINIWHPNTNGVYSFFGYDCRGIISTDKNGNYTFESCLPGTLCLKRVVGDSLPKFLDIGRPSHYHVKISYGGKVFVTQIYMGNEYFLEDIIRTGMGLKALENNKIELAKHEADTRFSKPYYTGKFDFVLP
jgi:protocatechuate 3,4-dioxygenase beta subunit